MNKLIDEISAIVSRHGKYIVTEERFVNILKDLYPDRDNPEKFNIIKWCINEGITAEIVNHCNVGNIKKYVEKKSEYLKKQNNADPKEVSKVLYAIAVGAGCITKTDYHLIKNSNQQNPAKQNPSFPQPRKKNFLWDWIKHIRFSSIVDLCLTIVAFLGLFATPFLYLAISSSWWPFFSVIAIAIIHFFVLGAPSVFLFSDDAWFPEFRKNKIIMAGAYIIVLAFAALFVLIGPCFTNKIYWLLGGETGMVPNEILYHGDDSATFFTFILCLIYCFFNVICMSFPWQYLSENGALHNINHKNFFSKDAIKGGLLSLVIILIISLILIFLPRIKRSIINNKLSEKIELLSVEYKKAQQKNNQLRHSRAAKTINLAFKDFFIGQEITQASIIINDLKDYSLVSMSSRCKLIVMGKDYSKLVDTVFCFSSIWDNKTCQITLLGHKNHVIGIKIDTSIKIDSIVSIYSKKYGKPEIQPKEMEPYLDSDGEIKIKEKYEVFETNHGEINHKGKYSWTYKNGTILIDDYTYSGNSILYIDNGCSSLLKNINAEEQLLFEIEQKRIKARNDSIKKRERQRNDSIEKVRQENHYNSVKQI